MTKIIHGLSVALHRRALVKGAGQPWIECHSDNNFVVGFRKTKKMYINTVRVGYSDLANCR